MPGNEYPDGMIEMDGDVGKLLKALDDLKIADDTIVIFTTDNPTNFRGPTPRRLRSAARRTPIGKGHSVCRQWSAGRARSSRVRSLPRSSPGSIGSRRCLPPSGTPRSRNVWSRAPRLATRSSGYTLTDTTSCPLGRKPKGARSDFAYFKDDGVLVAYRHENWKAVFCEMEKPGGFAVAIHLPAHPQAIQPAHGPL